MEDMTQELTDLLEKSVDAATFDVAVMGRLRPCTLPELKILYERNRASGNSPSWAAIVRVEENLRSELVGALQCLLSDYIAEDAIGATFLGQPGELTLARLADNVIQAAAIRSPKETAQLLNSWAGGDAVEYRQCAVLSGAGVDEPMEMEGGIRFEALPKSSDRIPAHVPFIVTHEFGEFAMMGALKVSIDCKGGPAFYRPGESEPTYHHSWDYGEFLGHPFDALCEALSLSSDSFVTWRAGWLDYSDDHPFRYTMGSRCSYHEEGDFTRGAAPLTRDHLPDVSNLLAKRSANQSGSGRLDRAIRRWMNSKREGDFADQFIELRIALEALYLKGASGELGFRLANYGAWHLGSDFDKRHEYRETLHRAYRFGSRAVHAGEVEASEENCNLLTAAQDLCRKGILKSLDQAGEPNWDDLILGNERGGSA